MDAKQFICVIIRGQGSRNILYQGYESGTVLVATWFIVIKNYINTLEIILPFLMENLKFCFVCDKCHFIGSIPGGYLGQFEIYFIYYFFIVPDFKKEVHPQRGAN
jgi:hypothetical protein